MNTNKNYVPVMPVNPDSLKVNVATIIVCNAINNMREVDSDYWESTVKQRLTGGAGSRYNHIGSVAEMELVLVSAIWEAVSSKSIAPDCRVYRAEIAGINGIIDLDKLHKGDYLDSRTSCSLENSKSMKVVLRDRKKTGKVSAEISAKDLPDDEFMVEKWTYLIVGRENRKDVCFTFHPGEPVSPSEVSAEGKDGVEIHLEEALALGFTHAKVVW